MSVLERWEENHKWLKHTGYVTDLEQVSMQLYGVMCAIDSVNRKEDFRLDCVRSMIEGVKLQLDDLAHGRSLVDTLPNHKGEEGGGE